MGKLSTYPQAIPVDGDLFPFTDDPSGTPATKNALAENIAAYVLTKNKAYGGISISDGSTPQTGLSSTPAKITGFTSNMASANMTPDHIGDDVTIDVNGDYVYDLQIAFSGAVSKTYRFEIFKNGTGTGLSSHRKLNTAGDVGSLSLNGIGSLVDTDVIDVRASSSDGATTITIADAQFNMARIG